MNFKHRLSTLEYRAMGRPHSADVLTNAERVTQIQRLMGQAEPLFQRIPSELTDAEADLLQRVWRIRELLQRASERKYLHSMGDTQ